MAFNRKFLLATTMIAGLVVPSLAAAQEQEAKKGEADNSAQAQPTQSAEAAKVDEVVVVGSRIRRDVFNSPSPVQVVTREETTLAGYSSTTDALQGTAVTGGASQINNAYGGYVTDGGPGANTLSLRGLGATRTLVLMNGRRVAPAGSRGSVGSADLNVLPTAMIDHVEILKDGASSIYGSDAVAGVVNIITRRNVNGIDVDGTYSKTGAGGGDESRVSIVAGHSGDRYRISGSAEYYERSNLSVGQRDWARCQTDRFYDPATGQSADYIDPLTGKSKCYPTGLTGENGVTINTIGTSSLAGVAAPGAVGGTFNRWRPNSAITSGLPGFEGVGGGANGLGPRDTFDPRMLNESLISPVKTYTAYLQGSYDLHALGNAEAYFELLGNERKSSQVGYRQLSLDYAVGSPLIPSDLAFSNQGATTALTNGQPLGVRAFIGFGNDRSEQDVKFLKGTAGVRGDLSFLDGWRYDVSASYTRSRSTYTMDSWLTDRLADSLNLVAAPTGFNPALVRPGADGLSYTCASNVANPAHGCIPAPVLNSATIGGRLPADWVNYTFMPVSGETVYTEGVVSAGVDGPLFKLPYGDVKGAFGVEFRKAKIDDAPPEDSQTGNLYNLTSAAVTRGSDSVWEAYGEFEIPVLRNLPFAKDLTLNVSGRFTDYHSYGSDQTYKVGGVYTPVKWLSLRGTYGTSFRAPALFEQFQGGTTGFLSSNTDPCQNYGALKDGVKKTNCASELPGQPDFAAPNAVEVISAGGADQGLKAETSKNATVGVIIQPDLPHAYGKLSLAVDYFNIEVDNGVSRVGASNIMSLCYNDPQFRSGGGYCRFIDARDPGGPLVVHDSYTNVATQVAKGIDYNLRYVRDLGPGSLRLTAEVTQFLSQAQKLFSTDPMDEYNGTLNTPKWTGTLDTVYSVRNWKFRYGLEWIGSMQSYGDLFGVNKGEGYDFDVPNYFLHSMSVQYTNRGNWQITAGVRNLTNEAPPTISAGLYDRVGDAPLYSGYDYFGRTMFVNISKHF